MNLKTTLLLSVAILAFSLLTERSLRAQATGVALSGTVTGPAGAAIPSARISVKNVTTGQVTQAQTDSAGRYSLSDLVPGDYEISVSAQGFGAKVAKVTLAAGGKQTLDLGLTVSPGSATEPSLGDLGFSPSAAKGNAQEQARLDRRSHMLQVHQRLGLITVAPLIATIFTGPGAKGHHGMPGSPTGRELHAALGSSTAVLYFTSAYFAIRAPKISGTETHGPIRLHKALAWIHGPGMILTPILGAIAYSQLSKGERVHGIAKYHSYAAYATAGAYGAAILSVSIKF